MKFKDIHKILNQIAPEELQEQWDNSGIQIRIEEDQDISKILTCLEISEKVIEEAVSNGVELIVTHHPLIFGKISNIDHKEITGNQMISLIQNKISVYSSHTAFDSALNGTNQYLAELIGMHDIEPIIPAEIEGCGMGRYGHLAEKTEINKLLDKILSVCGKTDIRLAGTLPDRVYKLGLCTGSGAEFIKSAYEAGCDAYITGDVKYHDARLADDLGICVIDAGHYGTEVIFAENMGKQLKDRLNSDVQIIVSKSDIYPFSDISDINK